jgi:hypothetical protein
MAFLALIGSMIYTYLFFSKHKLYNGIKNKIIKKILEIITYVIVIIYFSIFLSRFFMVLLPIGIKGLFVLFIFDIIGVIILIRRMIIKRKSVKNNNFEEQLYINRNLTKIESFIGNVQLKRIIIYLDILFSLFSISFILYTLPLPFVKHNNEILGIIYIYEYLNFIKIIVLIVFQYKSRKNNIIISKLIKSWFILSIISFIIPILFWILLVLAYSSGA